MKPYSISLCIGFPGTAGGGGMGRGMGKWLGRGQHKENPPLLGREGMERGQIGSYNT